MINKNNTATGFTLLELVIILAVLALLVQQGAASYTNHVRKSNDNHAKALLWQTQIALESCYLNKQNYNACNDVLPHTESVLIHLEAGVHEYVLYLRSKTGHCEAWQVNRAGDVRCGGHV